jgi:hypothetical protein
VSEGGGRREVERVWEGRHELKALLWCVMDLAARRGGREAEEARWRGLLAGSGLVACRRGGWLGAVVMRSVADDRVKI